LNVARLLSGAWRPVSRSEFHVASSKTEDLNLTETELNEISSLLCRLGAGALAWYKIRSTPLASTSAGEQLHEVYRRQRLSALLHERDLVDVLTLFRAEGIEAVLVKGWAIARRYPDPALRSYGDLDLCVAPAQFAKAQAILKRIQTLEGPFVDLHGGFGKIGVGKQLDLSRLRKWFRGARVNSLECDDQSLHSKELDGNSWDELYARSQVVDVSESPIESKFQIPDSRLQRPKTKDQRANIEDLGFPVRILGDEDHLRILCLHLLRSGARRPAWLCDVAIIIDGLRSLDVGRCTSFNWEICSGRNPVHAEWVGIAVRLAHELLGADISHTSFAGTRAPRWIVDTVLEQWGGKAIQDLTTLHFGPWTNAYRRWDNPIRATAAAGGKFTKRSRLRYRVAELVSRIPEVPDHVRAFGRQLKSTPKPKPQISTVQFRSENIS
jgi:hypothetical protein